MCLHVRGLTSAAGPDCGRAQALRHGMAAALWQHAVRGISPLSSPTDGAGARDRLAHAMATALGDLFVYRGDDAVAAAVLLVALDPRGAAWYGATVHGSRPLRVAAAGSYLGMRVVFCSGSCLGVSAGGGPSRPPPAQLPAIEPARWAASCQVAAGSSQAKHRVAT